MDGEESAATRSSTEVTSAARGGGLILRGDGRRIIGAELGGCEVLGAADDAMDGAPSAFLTDFARAPIGTAVALLTLP